MAIKSFRDRNPILVGLASIAVLSLVVVAAFVVGYTGALKKTYKMSGMFVDSGGITKGDNVLLAGIRVGNVTGVKAVHDPGPCSRKTQDVRIVLPQGPTAGCVEVTFNVKQGIHLGTGTHAEIVLATLLGSRAIRLTGPATAPYLEKLPSASRVISIDSTDVPFDIFDLITVSTHSIEATDTGRLNTLIKQLADITQGKRDQITTLLTSVSQISNTLNTRDAQVRELLDRADLLSKQLADKDQAIVALIDQSQGILQELQRRRDDIAVGLKEGDAAVAELDRIITANKATIDSILSALHPTLATVAAHQSDIDKSLTALAPGLLTQGQAASHGPWADIYVNAIGIDIVGCVNLLKGGPPPTPNAAACQTLLGLLKSLGIKQLPLGTAGAKP
jgi:phospholipid/cholesterol/gamma-HCH transport system substrate-binding protein